MSQVEDCIEVISKSAKGFIPQVGLILGSGLGQFCEHVEVVASIDFDELPGFPIAGVGGHAGKLLLAQVSGTDIAILQGRAHYYEKGKADAMAVTIETLKSLGCQSLVITNAAGSLIPEAAPGNVMLITDHINMTGVSPLFGVESNQRFVDMSEAYSDDLNDAMRSAAKTNDINLHEGIYAWMSGPQFETPAEIRAIKSFGCKCSRHVYRARGYSGSLSKFTFVRPISNH